MKFFAPFLLLFYFTTGYSFVFTPEDFVEACKEDPTDTNSVCYGYYQGVIDTLFVRGNYPCFNKSDKEIFAIAIDGVTDFVNQHPKEQGIFFPAAIIEKTLQEKFPCGTKKSVNS